MHDLILSPQKTQNTATEHCNRTLQQNTATEHCTPPRRAPHGLDHHRITLTNTACQQMGNPDLVISIVRFNSACRKRGPTHKSSKTSDRKPPPGSSAVHTHAQTISASHFCYDNHTHAALRQQNGTSQPLYHLSANRHPRLRLDACAIRTPKQAIIPDSALLPFMIIVRTQEQTKGEAKRRREAWFGYLVGKFGFVAVHTHAQTIIPASLFCYHNHTHAVLANKRRTIDSSSIIENRHSRPNSSAVIITRTPGISYASASQNARLGSSAKVIIRTHCSLTKEDQPIYHLTENGHPRLGSSAVHTHARAGERHSLATSSSSSSSGGALLTAPPPAAVSSPASRAFSAF